jgi:hypothetical protein
MAAAQAANDLMMMFTGLYRESQDINFVLNEVMDRKVRTVYRDESRACPHCGIEARSVRARGDSRPLPCRE